MKVLYPGSFNPFHKGHELVYNQACKMFGKENVWLGIGVNRDKDTVNAKHIQRSLVPITRNVMYYYGLTADLVKQNNFDLLIRGVRPSFSLEDEFQFATWNRKLCGVETILIPTHEELSSLSSSALRLLHENGKNIWNYMDSDVFGRWSTRTDDFDGGYEIYFGKCCSGKSTYLESLPVMNVDKDLFDFVDIPARSKTAARAKLKKLFYAKDMAFIKECCKYYAKVNWKLFFNAGFCIFDMPNIGTAWNFIPQGFKDRMTLIKVSIDEKNRKAFSKARGTNPKLIECSDFFYIDPKFWDEDVVIQAK